MNSLIELFLNECVNGIYIIENDEVITTIENIYYDETCDGDLILIDTRNINNKYIIEDIDECDILEVGDDLLQIHTNDKIIYIEMI